MDKEIKSINNIPICDETARSSIVKKLDKNQGDANAGKLLVVDENGYIKLSDPDDINFNNKYVLPIATSELLGGVMPVSKTPDMVKEVGVDENGKLFVKEDITQEEITQLKNKSDFSGKWEDIEGKPTIPDAVTVDSELNATSKNPVQNQAIYKEFGNVNKKIENIPTNFKKINNLEITGDGNIDIPIVTVDDELSETSTNAIQNQAVAKELDKKANQTDLGINKYSKSETDATVTLENGSWTVFPTMSSLNVSMGNVDENKAFICGFQFTSGDTATSLTLNNCTLTSNSDTVETNKTYEVNILDGSAIVREI